MHKHKPFISVSGREAEASSKAAIKGKVKHHSTRSYWDAVASFAVCSLASSAPLASAAETLSVDYLPLMSGHPSVWEQALASHHSQRADATQTELSMGCLNFSILFKTFWVCCWDSDIKNQAVTKEGWAEQEPAVGGCAGCLTTGSRAEPMRHAKRRVVCWGCLSPSYTSASWVNTELGSILHHSDSSFLPSRLHSSWSPCVRAIVPPVWHQKTWGQQPMPRPLTCFWLCQVPNASFPQSQNNQLDLVLTTGKCRIKRQKQIHSLCPLILIHPLNQGPWPKLHTALF